MPVQITVYGDPDQREYSAALQLEDLFQRELPQQASGRILIYSQAQLYAQKVRELDLVVIGAFTSGVKLELPGMDSPVLVNNFCFTIEVKDHGCEDVELVGPNLFVMYKGKLSPATSKSKEHMQALKNYFTDHLGYSPYICNFIWLRNVLKPDLLRLTGSNERVKYQHNFLPSSFGLRWLFKLACVQNKPWKSEAGNNYSFSSSNRLRQDGVSSFFHVFELFDKNKASLGRLTRQKLEMLSKKLLDNQDYAQAIGQKLVIISGRAGTGKTIKLLRIAYDLATRHDKRCLILTYNRALVSDIRRLIRFTKLPDDVDEATVDISTLHKFFRGLAEGFHLVEPTESWEKFNIDYELHCNELLEYLEQGAISQDDINQLTKLSSSVLDWDHILIDEAQDWLAVEKNILYKLFQPHRLIIADGVDQMVRGKSRCDWKGSLDVYRKRPERMSLRQKSNIVRFINNYARKCDLSWELEPNEELRDGRVIISLRSYDVDLHFREYNRCKEDGNQAYEMLFLVPPSSVAKDRNPMTGAEIRYSKLAQSLKNADEQRPIAFWDGTANYENRTEYPADVNQHRLLYYESCRGLEGWTVVCTELDELIKLKEKWFNEDQKDQQSLALMSAQEQRHQFAYLWSLIPLTRAIDTLIITVKDKTSPLCSILRDLAKEHKDFVEWIE